MGSSPTQPSNLNPQATQTLQIMMNKEETKSRFFLFRRRPTRHVPREWVRPADEEKYLQQLMAEGFITSNLLGKAMSDELAADVRELDQHLLPHFWRVNQLAKYYQNRYYQYQWIFILSAFLTTALAAINIYLHTGTSENTISGVLGFATAIVSGFAAAVSFLDANQVPQKQWYKARAQAEGLRSLYFLFLARQRPFDASTERERVQRMRQKVIDVLRSAGSTRVQRTKPNIPAANQPAAATDDTTTPPGPTASEPAQPAPSAPTDSQEESNS